MLLGVYVYYFLIERVPSSCENGRMIIEQAKPNPGEVFWQPRGVIWLREKAVTISCLRIITPVMLK